MLHAQIFTSNNTAYLMDGETIISYIQFWETYGLTKTNDGRQFVTFYYPGINQSGCNFLVDEVEVV